MLRIDVITIFPRLFERLALGVAAGRRPARTGWSICASTTCAMHALDRHRSVDDAPYGGGPGMVMKPEPLVEAIEALAGPKGAGREAHVVLLSPQGRRLDQALLGELAARPHLVLVCGRYEGVDQRAVELAVDEEISIGDYVLSGGEVPAMVVIEGVVRLLPGVLGNAGVGALGVVPDGTARGTPVHAAARVPRPRGAGGAALRRSRSDRALARRAGARGDAASGARICSSPARERNRHEPASTPSQPQPLRRDLPPFRSGRHGARAREHQGRRQGADPGLRGRGDPPPRRAAPPRTFTVRKISYGVGVERIFLLQSPAVAKVEIKGRGHVRRARLYYLRDLRGKKARLRSKIRDLAGLMGDTGEAGTAAEALAAEPSDAAPAEAGEAEAGERS